MLNFLKGWKTILFNLVMGSMLLIRVVIPSAELPDDTAVHSVIDGLDQFLIVAMPVGNMILRAITNSSIFKKTSPAPMPPGG